MHLLAAAVLFAVLLAGALPGARAAGATSASSTVKEWSAAQPAPIPLERLNGSPFDLKQLQGKVVVINLWAAWCAPCLTEMPVLARLARSFSSFPVEVLLVNTGDTPKAIERALAKAGAGLSTLRLAETAGPSWRMATLPATVIVDGSGRVRWLVSGAIDERGEPLRSLVLKLLPPAGTGRPQP